MNDRKINPYWDAAGLPQLRPSVTAFIDFLGYRGLTEQAFRDGTGQTELIRLRSALDTAYKHLEEQSTELGFDGKQSFQVRFFTDNLVIGFPFTEQVGAFG